MILRFGQTLSMGIILEDICYNEPYKLSPRVSEVTKAGGLNHLPYLLSISVSMAVIKDFDKLY